MNFTSLFTLLELTQFQIVFRMNLRNDDSDTIYWDGGAKKIAAWKEQHLSAVASEVGADGHCKDNWICVALDLLRMDVLDDESEPLTTPEKSKIDYVLNKLIQFNHSYTAKRCEKL